MCRSVPQTEATLTFTSTSVRPILGMATSRTSAPGFGSGFTTASMVSAIQVSHLPFLRAGGGVQQETPDSNIGARRSLLAWARGCAQRRAGAAALTRMHHGRYFCWPGLGTLSDFQADPRKCLARYAICPMW